MIIYIGADHRGFALKESIRKYLQNAGYDVMDEGNTVEDQADNFPEFAKKVAQSVSGDVADRKGILVCGSGAGMCITANKFPSIRASLVLSPDHAMAIRQEDDVNVLCLASDFTEEGEAKKIVSTWLQTFFSGEDRYRDRIEQIRQIEVELGLWK